LFLSVFGNVIELDSNFIEIASNGPWLVKFYAPWCGYCKKLEPVYNELEIKMKNLPIKVARIDATRYPDVASLYQIRGYPTIKYINGSDVFTHDGDRTVEHLILFSKRSLGLAMKHIPSEGRFQETIELHLHETFFLYIGHSSSYLKAIYNEIATSLRLRSYFYSVESQFIPQKYHDLLDLNPSLSDPENGTIIVWKHDKKISFHFKEEDINLLNSSLQNWIVINRFSTFPKISQYDLWELEILKKSIAIFLFNSSDIADVNSVNPEDPDTQTSTMRLFNLAKKMAYDATNDEEGIFYFVWSTDIVSMGDLAMMSMVVPNILIYQPWNQTIYLHQDSQNYQKMKMLNEQSVLDFLHSFKIGKIEGYGGIGFKAKLKRAGYDFITGLIEFVSTTPILAMFIIGVPLSVISFLCYAICCMDTSDSDYRRMEARLQKKIKKPLYEVALKSSEELNIKSEGDKKND